MSLKNIYAWNRNEKSTVASACGSSCGSGDKLEESPAACGAKDKAPASACGSACGAKDKQ